MKLRLSISKPLAAKASNYDSQSVPLPRGQLRLTPHPVPPHHFAGRSGSSNPKAEMTLLHDQLRYHFGVREVPRTNPVMVRGHWFGIKPNDDPALGSRQWRFYLYQPCAKCGELKPALQISLWRPGSRDYGLAATDNFARRAWRYHCQIARRRKQSRALLQEFVQQPSTPCTDCSEA